MAFYKKLFFCFFFVVVQFGSFYLASYNRELTVLLTLLTDCIDASCSRTSKTHCVNVSYSLPMYTPDKKKKRPT